MDIILDMGNVLGDSRSEAVRI